MCNFLRSMTLWREITFMKVTYSWDKAFCKMYFEVQMIRLKVMALHYIRIGIGDNKNFMSRYIIQVIIMTIDIITISLNSSIGTKIVKMSRKCFTDMNVSEQ